MCLWWGADKLHMGLEIGNLLLALALAGAMLAVFGRPICLHHREASWQHLVVIGTDGQSRKWPA